MIPLRALMFPIQYQEVGEAFMRAKGLSSPTAAEWLATLGIDPTRGSDAPDVPPGFVHGEHFAALLRILSQHCSDDRAHSEQILECFPVSAHGPLGLLAIVATNMRECIDYAIQFGPLVMPAFGLRMEIIDHQVHLIFERRTDFGAFNNLITEITLGCYGQFKNYADTPRPDGDYYFRHQPDGVPMYIPGTPPRCIHYGCREDKLVFPEEFLDRPLIMTSRGSRNALESVLKEQVAVLAPQQPFTHKVRQLIQRDVHAGLPSELASVAQRLELSSRTLSRRLQEEHNTFAQLNAQIRIEHAKAQLLHTNKPVSQIAQEAGFNEVGSFSRAFKRVYDKTPSEMRVPSGFVSGQA